jgi:DegV family protein with EDD domain
MIVIATDSTASLTKQEARQLGVIYIPMTYTVNGVQYTEKYEGDNGDFAALIESTQDLHTSQAAVGVYERTFRALRRAGFEVLCLTISSRLSGTYANATACAREIPGVRVVDTRTTAIGLAFLVYEARRMIQRGLSLEETAQQIADMRDCVKTMFTVEDMRPLRRSGRLGPVRQSVGTILNIRPLLTCRDGAVVACGAVRGQMEQLRSLAAAVPAHAGPIAVQYIRQREAALDLARRIQTRCDKPVTLRKLGPVLGIHLGADVLGAMWFEPKNGQPLP